MEEPLVPACPKPTPRKTLKARKDRHERGVIDTVRAEVMAREGYGCRFRFNPELGKCQGAIQWCHLWDKVRSRTMGMNPAERHLSSHSLAACLAHHDAIDARAYPKLILKPLTDLKANGPLQATRTELVHGEAVTTVSKVEIPNHQEY